MYMYVPLNKITDSLLVNVMNINHGNYNNTKNNAADPFFINKLIRL